MAKGKTVTVNIIYFKGGCNKCGAETAKEFWADAYKVQSDGLVKADGNYKRSRTKETIYIPLTGISSIEEYKYEEEAVSGV